MSRATENCLVTRGKHQIRKLRVSPGDAIIRPGPKKRRLYKIEFAIGVIKGSVTRKRELRREKWEEPVL